MAQEDSNGRLIWFVAGAAIGAAIAMLYAPASGADTRKYIGEKTRESGHALAESSKEMYDRGRDLYERGRKLADEAADMLERGRNIVEKAAEAAVNEAKSESAA
jgi:gas vesicle protein